MPSCFADIPDMSELLVAEEFDGTLFLAVTNKNCFRSRKNSLVKIYKSEAGRLSLCQSLHLSFPPSDDDPPTLPCLCKMTRSLLAISNDDFINLFHWRTGTAICSVGRLEVRDMFLSEGFLSYQDKYDGNTWLTFGIERASGHAEVSTLSLLEYSHRSVLALSDKYLCLDDLDTNQISVWSASGAESQCLLPPGMEASYYKGVTMMSPSVLAYLFRDTLVLFDLSRGGGKAILGQAVDLSCPHLHPEEDEFWHWRMNLVEGGTELLIWDCWGKKPYVLVSIDD